MAVGDDVTESFISVLGVNSNELLPVETTIPPEDLAWADSCLTKDPKELDSGWNSLKETLLEILSSQNNTSPQDEDKNFYGHEIEIHPSSNEMTGNSSKLVNTDNTINEEEVSRSNDELSNRKTNVFWSRYKMEDDFRASIHASSNETTADSCNLVNTDITSNEEGVSRINDELTDGKTDDFWSRYKMEDDFLALIRPSSNETTGDSYNLANTDITSNEEGDSRSNDEKTDDFWSRYKMEDVFLPTYDESSRDLGNLNLENIDLGVPEAQVDDEDIFKVWDLDIPMEEDELSKRLKRALAESSIEAGEGSSLDDLISGIADLSLSL